MLVSISNDECMIKCSKAEFDMITALIYQAEFDRKQTVLLEGMASTLEQAESLFNAATGAGYLESDNVAP